MVRAVRARQGDGGALPVFVLLYLYSLLFYYSLFYV